MTDYGLTSQQLEVIDALTSGVTMTAAAAQVGVHRNTIANWRRNNLPFQHAYAHAQYDRAILVREKMEELVDLAVDTLRGLLADPQASPSVRLKAALAVIQAVSTPPPPKKQVELEIEKLVVQSGPPKVVTLEQFGEATPVPPPPPVHNSAQVPYRREQPKVGRNETCPCGSGLKYKRCCLDKPLSAAA